MRRHPRPLPFLLAQLEALIQLRNISEGFAVISELPTDLTAMKEPTGSHFIRLALCLAQWMDLGYRDNKVFFDSDGRPAGAPPGNAGLRMLRLNLIDAYWCLSNEDPTERLRFWIEPPLPDQDWIPEYLVFLTRWKGRAHRKKETTNTQRCILTSMRQAATRLDNPTRSCHQNPRVGWFSKMAIWAERSSCSTKPGMNSGQSATPCL